MEFDEHEEQEEETGILVSARYESTLRNSGRAVNIGGGVEGELLASRKSGGGMPYRYRECLKNHALSIGGHAVDGCGEFMAAGDEGTLDALKCLACNCHRNFHRKEVEGEGFHQLQLHYSHSLHDHQQQQLSPCYRSSKPPGYFHLTPPPHQRPLALPSTSRNEEDMSNPSSSGGVIGGSGVGSSKKRFRTKFTKEQKDKMLEFADRLGWRFQKHDEAEVQHFCAETGVKRHVLKVWMHNNKHTVGKKP